jgi:hypothetical protein
VKAYCILIFVALVLYVVSFTLVGVSNAGDPHGGGGIMGYKCATLTLLSPWGSEGLKMVRENPIDFFSVLISGWINPVFAITVVALLFRPNGRFAGISRIVLLLMLPACWIVFSRSHLQPRVGYYLWTAAMLLAVFANKLVRPSSTAT